MALEVLWILLRIRWTLRSKFVKAPFQDRLPVEFVHARPSPDSVRRSHKMRFSAEVRGGSTRFKIWAPKCKTMKLKLKGQWALIELDAIGEGWHRLDVEGVGAETLYKYVLPDGRAIPDPTSRHQPQRIHGYSEVIDLRHSNGPTRNGRGDFGNKRSSTKRTWGHSPKWDICRRSKKARSLGGMWA